VTPIGISAAQVSALLPPGFKPQRVSREGFAWTIAHDLNAAAAAGKHLCVDCLALTNSKWSCRYCGCPEVLTVCSEDLGPIVCLIVSMNDRPVPGVFYAADVNALDWGNGRNENAPNGNDR